MTALLETDLVWQPEDYIFFKKCGEITISPDIQNIGFNCLFCAGICLQTEVFLKHLKDQHKEEVFKLYENQNLITFVDQDLSFVNNLSSTAIVSSNAINIRETLCNTKSTATNVCVSTNQMQNEELKENDIHLNTLNPTKEMQTTTSDLNLMYDIETNDLVSLPSSSNKDLENLITLNLHESFVNNIMTFSSNTSTITTNAQPTFSVPSKCVSSSSIMLKCSPANNECEIGDGEDSGIMMVQSPCLSDYGGVRDCLLYTDDNSRKFDMRKVLKNKDLIKYLLEAYKNNEKLWNPKHPSYKYNSPRTIYEELSQPLLNDKNYSLTGEQIFCVLAELRGRFRRELKKFEIRKGKHKTRLWYFDKMQFLRESIEEKRKERKIQKDTDDRGDLLIKEKDRVTNREILSCLLDLYRKMECLWNPKHQDYRPCKKMDLYNEISRHLKATISSHMTPEDCFNEIQKLRIRYCKELRILHKLNGMYMPKLWCFDEMEFLKPVMEEKIMNNLKKINIRKLSLSKRKHDFKNAMELKFANVQQHLKFIEIYRSFNSLWDVDNPDYRSTNYRRKYLNEMLEVVNFTFKEKERIKLEQLEKTLHLLRKDFSKEKQKRLNNNDLNKDCTRINYFVYEKLNSFLEANLGPFLCTICQRICKTSDQYKIHKSKHDGTLPFICTICGKGFQTPGNLTIHIRRHRRDFPYACEICTKSFATSTEVSIHMRSHTGERPYSCERCDKKFKTWSFYHIHKRAHLNQSNFHCPICDKAFFERNRFTDHMNIHLNIRKHQCEKCGKGFTTLANLKKHLDLHDSF